MHINWKKDYLLTKKDQIYQIKILFSITHWRWSYTSITKLQKQSNSMYIFYYFMHHHLFYQLISFDKNYTKEKYQKHKHNNQLWKYRHHKIVITL